MSTFSLLISPPDALQPGFTESFLSSDQRQGARDVHRIVNQKTLSYITERSATTCIAAHPELRLMA